jgi:hypothetical protein
MRTARSLFASRFDGALLFEFPYAGDVIDFALADLVGRRTAFWPPWVFRPKPSKLGKPGTQIPAPIAAGSP